ncbi:MAG: STAS domain-containing protein [Fuerstiella sp.]|nr:STAS domain-containing protein [Fuerstiella sp.]MCP4787479.1 STAS domain-containing protein [Fuerstiella sp.]MCP4859006.1 STAS domain-containing protein [Fuerstiella sp.]
MPVFRGVYSFSETDDYVHVSIGDAFAEGAWPTQESVLRELIGQLFQSKSQAVLLNLSSLSNTNSAVVTAIVRIWKSIVATGGRLAVFAPLKETRCTLQLTGLSTRMAISENAGDALHQLGLSRTARLTRRETMLLKCISPIAAAAAVMSLVAMLLSISPPERQPSILFVLVLSAAIASGGGWIAAVREIGGFCNLSRLVSATGVITLLTAIGQWSI